MPNIIINSADWSRTCPRGASVRVWLRTSDDNALNDQVQLDFSGALSGSFITDIPYPDAVTGWTQLCDFTETQLGNFTVTASNDHFTVGTGWGYITNNVPSLDLSGSIDAYLEGYMEAHDPAVRINVNGSVSDECPGHCSTMIRGYYVDSDTYAEHYMGVVDSPGAAPTSQWVCPSNACGFVARAVTCDPYNAVCSEREWGISFMSPARKRFIGEL